MCEFCKDIINENDWNGWDDGIVKTSNKNFDIRIFNGCCGICIENISFCPYCGRKLTETEDLQ